MVQSRWNSKVLWVAIFAQVISILLLVGVIDLNQGELANQIVASVLQLFTLIGVLNDPNDAVNW